MLALFNETILDLSAADQDHLNKLESKNKDELTTFLAKVANVTRETRTGANSSGDLASPNTIFNDAERHEVGASSLEKFIMSQSNVRERERDGNSPSRLSTINRKREFSNNSNFDDSEPNTSFTYNASVALKQHKLGQHKALGTILSETAPMEANSPESHHRHSLSRMKSVPANTVN